MVGAVAGALGAITGIILGVVLGVALGGFRILLDLTWRFIKFIFRCIYIGVTFPFFVILNLINERNIEQSRQHENQYNYQSFTSDAPDRAATYLKTDREQSTNGIYYKTEQFKQIALSGGREAHCQEIDRNKRI